MIYLLSYILLLSLVSSETWDILWSTIAEFVNSPSENVLRLSKIEDDSVAEVSVDIVWEWVVENPNTVSAVAKAIPNLWSELIVADSTTVVARTVAGAVTIAAWVINDDWAVTVTTLVINYNSAIVNNNGTVVCTTSAVISAWTAVIGGAAWRTVVVFITEITIEVIKSTLLDWAGWVNWNPCDCYVIVTLHDGGTVPAFTVEIIQWLVRVHGTHLPEEIVVDSREWVAGNIDSHDLETESLVSLK